MKKITFHCLVLLLILCTGQNIKAQCTTWQSPSPDGSWPDFNSTFFGAPCGEDDLCPYNEIQFFEVFASEAYRINFFQKGGTYAFSMCDGPGAGSWVPEFTIITPSGTIDAFGPGDGDSCTITWTASENGEYIIVINEADMCGGGENTSTDNGYPAITCISDAPCVTVDSSQCYQWLAPSGPSGYTDFNAEYGGAPCNDGTGCAFYEIDAFEVYASEAYEVSNFKAGGEYVFSICNGPGAGTWVPEFTIIAPSGKIDASGGGDGDQCSITWIASEDGTYLLVVNEMGVCGGGNNTSTNNGYPALTCMGNVMCDTMVMDTCFAGNLISDSQQVICTDSSLVILQYENEVVPAGGTRLIRFSPGAGGTGGLNTTFIVNVGGFDRAFNSDLNGALSANNLDPFAGQWMISAAISSDTLDNVNSICDVSEDAITVYFNSEMIVSVEDLGGGSANVSVSGGTAPYTYAWSDPGAQVTETVSGLTEGEFTVEVTDAVGCTAEAQVTIVISSTNNLHTIAALIVSPNPSNGVFTVDLQLKEQSIVMLNVIDVSGKRIASESRNTAGEKVDFDLAHMSNGLYFLEIIVDSKSTFRKILVTH